MNRSHSEAELEEIVAMLRDGTVDVRSAAAEKLFNKAAEDETARQRTASLGVVQPLVRMTLNAPLYISSSIKYLQVLAVESATAL